MLFREDCYMIPTNVGGDRWKQRNQPGQHPGVQSSQMFGEYSSQCSICLLIICCSSLLEFSVQIFGCLTILASWCGTHSNIQMFIAFIQMFPYLHPNTPSTPSSKARVHAPANECVGTGISIVSPTMHTVIVRGSSLVKRVGSGARRGVGCS